MTIHDITLTMTPDMPVWPGDPALQRTLIATIGPDSAANVSQVTMSVHTGTHVDAPIHFISGGAGVETLSLDALVGPCVVGLVQAGNQTITAGDLEALHLPPATERLLLKTSNSDLWEHGNAPFQTGFVALSPDAAQWIVKHGIKLVGVDYLSVEPFGAQDPVVHRTLLSGGVIPLEGVNLSEITPGEYLLVCLPLKLAGSDGAPARVILIENS